MGYDMTWQNDTDHEHADFRLNIGGMTRYANAMHRLGMLYEADPTGQYPYATDHGTAWEHVHNVEGDPDFTGDLTEDQRNAARRYIAIRDEYLAQHPGDTQGIPSFKLTTTNDDWWVTPEECRAALTAYLNAGPADIEIALGEIPNREYWAKWISYLSQAVDHGGFRVG